jgi:AcrR family transcriptional regulator
VPGDPREVILDTAAQLFATKGYAATGTREIAAAVGLRQASLFHYFRRKEDLFAELLDRTVSPSLAGTAWLMHQSEPAHVRLYVLARQDVMNLCGTGHNLAALQLLPEARDERFADFWSKRSRLRSRYRTLVRAMARDLSLASWPIEFVTDFVFGAVESTMTWSEQGRSRSPARTSHAVAAAAVRGVMAEPPTADQLRAAGDAMKPSVGASRPGAFIE